MILLNETEKHEVIYDGFNNGDQNIYMTRFFYFITYFSFYIFPTLYNEKKNNLIIC